MNSPDQDASLIKEIQDLRERLESAVRRHSEEIDSIRQSIASLEVKLYSKPAETEKEPSAMRQAKAAATKPAPVVKPPPIPKEYVHAKREEPIKLEPAPELEKKPEPIAKAKAKPEPELQPTPEPVRQDSGNTFELEFGRIWFVRIGIVILLTGLVFLGNYAYQNWIREMPNGVRLAALFACAIGLVEAGRRLAAKENLNRFGEVLLAGGMAFFYYCTFAAHHVGRLKVIDSPALAAVLLFGAAGAIATVSWLRQAKATAILGIVLASYSTMLQPIGWMSCVSSILLGALGLFFMLKPGWSGPGWVSMLGSYGAFLGWNLLGASGQHSGGGDTATLWFLPPLWAMFATPGVVGNFRESLSDRARAWFTAINNALFFLLFSGIWIGLNGDDNYWMVAAVFGPILIALGILGRRQDTAAGGVNFSQGLAVATFALVLKLDGHHLALTLAFESLALAIASWKYRGKSEAIFSLLAGLGRFLLIGENELGSALGGKEIPVWSGFLAASLLGASSFVTSRIRITGEIFTPFLRLSSLLFFVAATLVAGYLCLFRIGEIPALITAILLMGALAFTAFRLDTERSRPELTWAALWFLGVASWVGFEGEKTLQLTLAIECLALALVSLKLRSRSESVFSFGAGMIAAVLALESGAAEIVGVPIWSTALLAALVAAASVVTVRIRMKDEAFARFARISSAFLFVAATLVISQLCLLHLRETPAILTTIALCGALSIASLKLDRKRLQPEFVWASLWFLIAACYRASTAVDSWMVVVAATVALAGCWLWHRQPEPERKPSISLDLADIPMFPAWAFSIAVPFLVWVALPESGHPFLQSQIAALALVFIAIALRCKSLTITSGIFGLLHLTQLADRDAPSAPHIFGAVAIALGAVASLHNPWTAKKLPGNHRKLAGGVFRLTAFVAYCAAWHSISPLAWPDWIALTSLALTVACVFLQRKILEESIALLAVALAAFFFHTTTSPWSLAPESSSWRGFGVVIGLLAIVMTCRQRPALIADAAGRDIAIRFLAGLTCLITTLWSTQMLVWRFDWKPAAVLWTVLGFAFVTAGLWQRLHILRVCGFILLILSFLKLFISDVWDFTAFMRVASFIVLGVALILLGLFYNKFADVIRKLLEDEKVAGERD